jgi:hypothetical protein
MKFYYKLFSIVFLFPLFSLAQSHYKPGYIVNLKGDTAHGYIDYKGWDLNPDFIRFKPLTGNTVEKLTVNDIDFFSIDKITSYKRYEGFISMDNTSEDHMIEFRDTSFKVATVFLQVLQKGKNLSLYSYSDAIKSRYYIGEQPGFEPAELVYRLYYDMTIVTATHGGRTVNEDTYMKQLFTLAIKYDALSPWLQRALEEAGYREYNLVQVVKKINQAAK